MTLSLRQWIKLGFTTRQAEALEAVAGSGTSAQASRHIYSLSGTTGTSRLSWSLGSDADHPLDLTDPTQPTAKVAGVYTFTAYALVDSPGAAWKVALDADIHNDDAQAYSYFPDAGVDSAGSVTLAWALTVAMPVQVQASIVGNAAKAVSGYVSVVFQPAALT